MALLLFLLLQDDPAARLRAEGWKAVDALAARPESRAALEKLGAGADPELRWWAGATLAAMEAGAPPPRVSLEARNESPAELLKGLLAKAGVQGVSGNPGGTPVTATLRDVPLLEALDEVCRKGQVTLKRTNFGFEVIAGTPPKGPRFYHGGFGATVTSLVKRTETTFEAEPSTKLHLGLVLRADPRTRFLAGSGTCEVVDARDDTGRTLLPGGRPVEGRLQDSFLGEVAERVAAVDAVLAPPAPEARSIALLRGVARGEVATRTTEVVFEKVLIPGPQVREAGDLTLTLKGVTAEKEMYAVELEMISKIRCTWPESDDISMEDGEGNALQRWESSSSWGGTRAKYSLQFKRKPGTGEPAKIRFPVLTGTAERRVYFEFRGIRLQ